MKRRLNQGLRKLFDVLFLSPFVAFIIIFVFASGIVIGAPTSDGTTGLSIGFMFALILLYVHGYINGWSNIKDSEHEYMKKDTADKAYDENVNER